MEWVDHHLPVGWVSVSAKDQSICGDQPEPSSQHIPDTIYTHADSTYLSSSQFQSEACSSDEASTTSCRATSVVDERAQWDNTRPLICASLEGRYLRAGAKPCKYKMILCDSETTADNQESNAFINDLDTCARLRCLVIRNTPHLCMGPQHPQEICPTRDIASPASRLYGYH